VARRLWPAVAALVLLPTSAVLVGNIPVRTFSLLQDRADTVTSVRAATGAITITPDMLDLGTFWVGDKCTDVPVATVSTTWPVVLSVTASGWLNDRDVSIMPGAIGPGETATVTFTNAAVNGPTDFFEAVITVHGDPGGLEQVFRLTGRVENPASPGTPPPPLPEGCEHPAGKAKVNSCEGLEPLLADPRKRPRLLRGPSVAIGDLPEGEATPCRSEGAAAPPVSGPTVMPVRPPAPEAPAPAPEAPAPAPEAPVLSTGG
jgi:hypothetical protein